MAVKVNGQGNAVLSYTRGGVILWNYHIWVTETSPFINFYATGGNVNGTAQGGAQAKFMDRNLGALAATTVKPSTALAYKYFGVLYQHGRPTPFSGQGIGTTVNRYTIIYKGDATAINSNDTEGIGGYTQSNTAVSSATDAIKTPNTCYYYLVATTPREIYTWYDFEDISLWSDYGTNKSIYDPCPYGYRVPINGSWNSWTTQSSQAWSNPSIDGGLVMSGTWWPAAGWRNSASGAIENVGAYGFYWSSSRYSSAYQSYYLYFNYNGGVGPSNNANRSYGLSVRCVQERARFAWDLGHGTWERWCAVLCWDPSATLGMTLKEGYN